uniref:HAP1 N-terminal domain-containing protein n=1 Tax=Rhabditophanes sp. KR3021 TaxID=114890 RepID=A0AC35TY98_9BILA
MYERKINKLNYFLTLETKARLDTEGKLKETTETLLAGVQSLVAANNAKVDKLLTIAIKMHAKEVETLQNASLQLIIQNETLLSQISSLEQELISTNNIIANFECREQIKSTLNNKKIKLAKKGSHQLN